MIDVVNEIDANVSGKHNVKNQSRKYLLTQIHLAGGATNSRFSPVERLADRFRKNTHYYKGVSSLGTPHK